jgi:outer membrane protein TolC
MTRPLLLSASRVSLLVAALSLAGCSTVRPVAHSDAEWLQAGRLGVEQMQAQVPSVGQTLTLDEALARALKYNLDRRARLMEEALAFKQLDAAHLDMLPKLVASAGYSTRNNDKLTTSNGQPGQASLSTERSRNLRDLDFTWSALDVGVGYYGAMQQADRVLVASERRRKAMHLLMQDVRTAYWRAVSAQTLLERVRTTIVAAEQALDDSRKTEAERLRNPVEALRYQRQLLESLRLLESIQQELSTARIDLAALINVPLVQNFTLQEPAATVSREALDVPLERLEEQAFVANADLREQAYNVRIAQLETRRTLVRMFPNLSFNWGYNYDSDRYLVNNHWQEAGLQLSFNLFNLLTGRDQMKLARAGVALAEQRRLATQMAVMAQVHLARLQLANAVQQFERAESIWNTDSRIAELMKNREAVAPQGKLEVVSNETTAILSLLRRYQALSLAQAAEARLKATVGMEPAIGSVDAMELPDLAQKLSQAQGVWAALKANEPVEGPKW